VTSRGYKHAYMDTDSIFTDSRIAAKLSRYFDPLNPYNFKAPLLKIEKEDRWFYGISSKRYHLPDHHNRKTEILDKDDRDYKLHGLGHLCNPLSTGNESWHKEIWEDIRKLDLGVITIQDIIEKYNKFYAVSRLTVTTPTVWNRFNAINEEKPLTQQTKPFNFFLIGIGNKQDVKPIAPYTKNTQTVVHKPFIDYETGKVMQGEEYWRPLHEIIINYINHPEAKLEGDVGLLKRRHLQPTQIIHIGKETRNIETQILQDTEIQSYINPQKILEIKPKQARKAGVSRQALWAIQKRIEAGKRLNPKTKAVKKLIRLI